MEAVNAVPKPPPGATDTTTIKPSGRFDSLAAERLLREAQWAEVKVENLSSGSRFS